MSNASGLVDVRDFPASVAIISICIPPELRAITSAVSALRLLVYSYVRLALTTSQDYVGNLAHEWLSVCIEGRIVPCLVGIDMWISAHAGTILPVSSRPN